MDRNDRTSTDKPVGDQPIDGRDLQHDDPLDATLPGDGSGTAPENREHRGEAVGAAVGAGGGAGPGDHTAKEVEEADPAVRDYPR